VTRSAKQRRINFSREKSIGVNDEENAMTITLRQGNAKVSYRSGQSYAIGTIIDGYLTKDEEERLYAGWQTGDPDWPQPLVFQGGVTAITCEMVLEVPETKFNRAYGKGGKAFGDRMREISKRHAS
jgi:hypothetical protein